MRNAEATVSFGHYREVLTRSVKGDLKVVWLQLKNSLSGIFHYYERRVTVKLGLVPHDQ